MHPGLLFFCLSLLSLLLIIVAVAVICQVPPLFQTPCFSQNRKSLTIDHKTSFLSPFHSWGNWAQRGEVVCPKSPRASLVFKSNSQAVLTHSLAHFYIFLWKIPQTQNKHHPVSHHFLLLKSTMTEAAKATPSLANPSPRDNLCWQTVLMLVHFNILSVVISTLSQTSHFKQEEVKLLC